MLEWTGGGHYISPPMRYTDSESRAMTTIDTIHDLSRILREHPEWREELRRTLLTEELLALPQRLAEYAEKADRSLEAVEGRLEAVDRRLEVVDRRLESVDRRLDALEKEMALNTRETAMNTRHIGEMKGMFMERDVAENAALIASDMGLVWQKSLDRQDVVALVDEAVRSGQAEGIPTNHLRVLRRADLIMEATDERGWPSYVVAEISWTAAERDTDRAIRNAGYVALFTGRTTYAAVASVHVDKEIADMLTQDAPQPHGSATYEKAFHASVDEQPPLE